MFCDLDYTKSHEYKAFWDKLGRGEFEAANLSDLPKAVKKFGSMRPTTLFVCKWQSVHGS